MVAASLDGELYVAGLDVSGGFTAVVAVDDRGHARRVARLPLAVTGMAACDGALVVGGGAVEGEDGGARVVAVGGDGRILWGAPLAGEARPLIACVAGLPYAVWDAADALAVTLLPAPGGSKAASAPWRVPVADATYALEIDGLGDRLIALRLHGPELRLELLAFADGHVVRRASFGEPRVREAALDVAGQVTRVAWLTAKGEIAWQSFDGALTPESTGGLHVDGARPTAMGWIADGERVALRLSRLTGEYEPIGHGLSPESTAVVEEVVMLPGGGSTHRLVPPGTRLRAGAWLGDRLVLLHGADGAPFVSVYGLGR